MKASKLIIGTLAAAFLLQACNSVDFQKTASGIPYKVFSSAKGDSIRQNYIVKFMVIQKIGDSVRYSSYKDGIPQYTQVQPLTDSLTYADIGGNIVQLLPKLKTGDSLYLVQSADSMIKMNPIAGSKLKKGEQIVTTVRIVSVFKNAEDARVAYMKDSEGMRKASLAKAAQADKDNLGRFQKDTAAQVQLAKDTKVIEAYLASHNIKATKTDWGVYIQVVSPGQGAQPGYGQFASLKYNGKHLSGESFDAGTLPLQIGAGGVIKGFEEGVRQMTKGEKIIAYIPSILGYGPAGSPPKIKPNENLAFELELLDISDTPPQQEQPPMPADTSARAK